MNRRVIAGIIFGAALAGTGWLHYSLLTESYGAGEPYFSRTANMDKWSSPWPALIAIDVVTFATGCILLLWSRKR
jgi:hypothetical protein